MRGTETAIAHSSKMAPSSRMTSDTQNGPYPSVEALTRQLREYQQQATGIAGAEAGSWAKSLADTVSGEIAGRNFPGRIGTPGAGRAANY